MHWPIPLNPKGNDGFIPKRPDGSRDIDASWDIKDTWKQMEALVKKGKSLPTATCPARYNSIDSPLFVGKIRSIGVSNCSIPTLEKFLPGVSTVPATNQLELHIYNPDHKLVSYCKEKGITPQAYSPLGSNGSPLIKDETVQKIAEERGLAPAEVLLGWLGMCICSDFGWLIRVVDHVWRWHLGYCSRERHRHRDQEFERGSYHAEYRRICQGIQDAHQGGH